MFEFGHSTAYIELCQGVVNWGAGLRGFSPTGDCHETITSNSASLVDRLQMQIKLRHQLADDLLQSQLALGYSVPEVLEKQDRTMLAKADDDAFGRAMSNLHMTMSMFAMAN